jgi:very-short-patch-repair endonuclease
MVRSSRAVDKRVLRSRRLRRDATDAERKLWPRLRRLSINDSHFRRQATIGPYFADFACHRRRLVIELDGGQHNREEEGRRDARRDAYMRANGYRILRFWNNDVMHNIEGVIETIAQAMRAPPPPTPDPSPPLASLAGGGANKRRARGK